MCHPILCFAMVFALLLGASACGGTDAGQQTPCPKAHLDATVVGSSPGSGDLRISGSTGCHGVELEVLLIELPSAEAPLAPSLRDGSYTILWSTDQATFDHIVTVDQLVTLSNGQPADARAGYWMLGMRQADTVTAQPLPEGF